MYTLQPISILIYKAEKLFVCLNVLFLGTSGPISNILLVLERL